MKSEAKIKINSLTSILWKFYFFFLPFETLLETSFGIKSQLKPYRVIALLILFISFLKLIINKKANIRFKGVDFLPTSIILIGILVSLINYFVKPNLFDWDLFFLHLNQILLGLLMYLLFRSYLSSNSIKKLESILKVYAIAVCLNNLFLIIQGYFLVGLIDVALRPSGFIANPNSAGLQNVIIILFLLFKINQIKAKKLFLVYSALIIFLLIGIFYTQSRVSLMIVLLVLANHFFQLSSTKKIIVGSSIIVLTIFFGGFLVQTEMFNRIERKSKSNRPDERVEIWSKAMQLGVDTKFLGVGIGQFQRKSIIMEYFSITNFPTIRGELRKGGIGFGLHNTFIHILIVYGFFSFVIFLIYIFLLNRKLYIQSKLDKFNKGSFNVFLWISFLAIVMYSFTGELLLAPIFWIFFAIFGSYFKVEKNYEYSEEINK